MTTAYDFSAKTIDGDEQKLSALQRTGAFANEERVRQDHLHTPALVRFEDEFVLTVAFKKRHWTNTLKAFRFAVRAGELRHFDVAVADRRHDELAEQRRSS